MSKLCPSKNHHIFAFVMRGLFFLAPSLQASTLRSLRLLLPRCLFDRRWAAAANGFPATPKWPPHTRCMTRAAASRKACRHMLASLTPRSCISYTRAATSRVQHCWQRRSLLIVSLSYKLNMTCAAGAPTAPSTGRKPGISWVLKLVINRVINHGSSLEGRGGCRQVVWR